MRFHLLAIASLFALVGACDQLTGIRPEGHAMCSATPRADTVVSHYFLTPAGDTVLVGPKNVAPGGWWITTIVSTPGGKVPCEQP